MNRSAAAREYFANDGLARELDLELVEAGLGTARVRIPPSSRRVNGLGGTHGALIFALADIAFATACNSHGQTAIGVQANISYVAPAGEGPLEAHATEISRGRRLATYDVHVRDAQERLVAAFQGTAYVR